MIIFNEYEHAEQLVHQDDVVCTTKNLMEIARWYHENDKDLSFIASNLYYRLKSKNLEKIDFILKHYKDRELRRPSKVIIYKNELKFIEKECNYNYQKILFILLCICRITRGIESESLSIKSGTEFTLNKLIKIAKVNLTKKEQSIFLKYLKDNKYAKMDNVWNLQLNYANAKGDVGLEFYATQDMIYRYEKYVGKKIIECQNCGVLVKINNKKTTAQKYCENCAKIVKNQQNLQYYHNRMDI